jgi:hypothetical protein
MRSESTSALGQPSDTRPTRGAGLGAARRGLVLSFGDDLRADLVAVFCMGGL